MRASGVRECNRVGCDPAHGRRMMPAPGRSADHLVSCTVRLGLHGTVARLGTAGRGEASEAGRALGRGVPRIGFGAVSVS